MRDSIGDYYTVYLAGYQDESRLWLNWRTQHPTSNVYSIYCSFGTRNLWKAARNIDSSSGGQQCHLPRIIRTGMKVLGVFPKLG